MCIRDRLIESTGIAEPMPVAETFTFRDEEGRSLGDVARLDTMVTVVDAFNFLREYEAADGLTERGLGLGPDDDRTVVDLLVEQVEFADVIAINKSDLVDEAHLRALEALLARLNTAARIVRITHGAAPLDAIFDTGRFDLDRAANAPGWLATLRGDARSEADEYGIASFVYRARRPFHPARFWELTAQRWEGVIRSKGLSLIHISEPTRPY